LNYFTWSSIGVRRDASGRRRIVFTPADANATTVDLETDDAEIVLLIDCQELRYRFGFEEVIGDGRQGKDNAARKGIRWVGEVSMAAMVAEPPIGMNFTGMMLGLYAFGNMQRCLAPADFAYAEVLESASV